jgi:hypothetical protein
MGEWQIQLCFSDSMRPIESSVTAVAAAPHHDDEVRQVVPTQLKALSHIQRQKKSLMLLKCTVVSTSTLKNKIIPEKTKDNHESMLCNETMQSCCFSTPKKNLQPSTTAKGKEVVLKMRQPSTAFHSEGTRMLTMIENDAVASLLPTVHAFVKFEYDGKHWGGICTDHYKWCVNTIIYSGDSYYLFQSCLGLFQSCFNLFRHVWIHFS